MAELQTNNDVLGMQEVLIENLEKIGFRNITAQSIGNHTTGAADGKLGDGSATALSTLLLMAQIAEGKDPSDITSSYNSDSIASVEKYLTERGVDAESVSKFVEGAKTVFPGGESNEAYDEANINMDNMSAELNIAELHFLGEGAVEIVENDPAESTNTFVSGFTRGNGDVAAMQELLINNLDKIGGLPTAEQIGGKDGQPDDLLGHYTATALQTVVLSAQVSSGVENPTLELNDTTKPMVEAYLLNKGITEEEVTSFMRHAESLSGNLNNAYTTLASVDHTTLQSSDNSVAQNIDVMDEAPEMGANDISEDESPEIAQNGFDHHGGITGEFSAAAENSLEAEGMVTPTAPLTLAEYEKLSNEDVLTLEEQYMVESFPEAREQALKEAGFDDARAQYEEAQRYLNEDVPKLITETREQLADAQSILEQTRASFADEKITYGVTNGTETFETRMSLNEIEEKDGEGFLFFGDGDTDREQAAYDAGRAAFEQQLQNQTVNFNGEEMTYAELTAVARDLDEKLPHPNKRHTGEIAGSLEKDAQNAVYLAQREMANIENSVNESGIMVATGEPEPVVPSVAEELIADTDNQTPDQTLEDGQDLSSLSTTNNAMAGMRA